MSPRRSSVRRTHTPAARRRTQHRTGRQTGGLATLAAAVALAAGCASSPSGSDGEPISSGLDGLRPAGSPAGAESAADTEAVNRLLDDTERLYQDLWSMDGEGGGAARREPRGAEEPAEVSTPPAVSMRGLAAEQPEDTPEPPAEPEPTAEERVGTLVRELAAAMRADTDIDPYALAIRLAGLTAAGLSPAEAEAIISRLAVDERETARAVLDLAMGLDSDPDRVADLFAERAALLSEARPIRISSAALCSRVEAFGRYTELPTKTFVAGTPIRMVVYAEVEHFNHAPITSSGSGDPDGAEWEIRLSQELLLYHESDGLLAWRQPEEDTVYRSKTRLRDFFVVNRIDLPSSLTVGSYRLKVVMRDQADRSVDERIIPISVVADPRLANGYGG